MIEIKESKLKILKIIDETPDTKTFRVQNPGIDFYPGQFFMVRFEDSDTFKRAYSVASSPEEKSHMDITMNLVGDFTKKLWQTKINDILVFKGPYGKFYFNETMGQDIVLIGGGLGIVPMMSIIRYCRDKNLKNKINLIYSVRTPNDITYREELEKIKFTTNNFKYAVTVTRPDEKSLWTGKTGRIDTGLLKNNIGDVKNSLFYLCGPLGFVKSAISILETLGAGKDQIKTDIWGE
jgi:glycine betaine catabolism B